MSRVENASKTEPQLVIDGGRPGILMSDSSIVNSLKKTYVRKLQPWIPDTQDGTEPLIEEALGPKDKTEEWDQFKTNQEKFGYVKMPIDESIYTTPLNRNSDFYQNRIEEATRISKEILSAPALTIEPCDGSKDEMILPTQSTTNIVRSLGAYIPPSLRAKVSISNPDENDTKNSTCTDNISTESSQFVSTDTKSLHAKQLEPLVEQKQAKLPSPSILTKQSITNQELNIHAAEFRPRGILSRFIGQYTQPTYPIPYYGNYGATYYPLDYYSYSHQQNHSIIPPYSILQNTTGQPCIPSSFLPPQHTGSYSTISKNSSPPHLSFGYTHSFHAGYTGNFDTTLKNSGISDKPSSLSSSSLHCPKE